MERNGIFKCLNTKFIEREWREITSLNVWRLLVAVQDHSDNLSNITAAVEFNNL